MNSPLVVLLAGGEGKNFAPFATNKLLWPFLGRPYISYVVDSLRQAGLDDIVAVTSSQTDTLCQELGLMTRVQAQPKGMDDAILQVHDDVRGRSILVVNGDDVVDPTLFTTTLKAILDNTPKIAVAGFKTARLLPLGYYSLKDDKVVGIVEKPTPEQKPSDYASLMCDYFQDTVRLFSLLKSLPHEERFTDMRYEEVKNRMFAESPAYLVKYGGGWHKLKYPHHVLDVENVLITTVLQKMIADAGSTCQQFFHPTASVSPKTHIEGLVYIDEGAQVDESAVIKGPVYIGRNARIGNHTLVRQSLVEEGSTVGFGSEVARSYIGPHCDIHHAYIGDSVLEGSVNMSWGSVTANVRLDKKSVRVKLPNDKLVDTERGKLGALIASGSFVGVNASTMPGAVLPANSQILPNSIVQ